MSKKLISKILELSNAIHKESIKGNANYIVCSPSVSNFLYKRKNVERMNKIYSIYENKKTSNDRLYFF